MPSLDFYIILSVHAGFCDLLSDYENHILNSNFVPVILKTTRIRVLVISVLSSKLIYVHLNGASKIVPFFFFFFFNPKDGSLPCIHKDEENNNGSKV